MNLGIDFGSTYSSFAIYNKEMQMVELCRPTHSESEAVPTVACLDENGALITGHEAREQIREDPETISFDAFKMLLTESDQAVLRQRGYEGEYTPRMMTERFLNQQIRKILTNYNEPQVENLVICVPEVWTTKEAANRGMLDGRIILKTICESCPDVKQVQVVSEPAAASAYFSNCYQKKTGKQMSGCVLIIDYGGGTLDLTLTQISSGQKDASAMEIEVKNRAGVGENQLGKIGDAGIAYMEEVVRLALSECDKPGLPAPDAIDPKDPRFRSAYHALERKLKAQTQASSQQSGVEEASFQLYNVVQDCIDDISQMEDNHDCFSLIRYGKIMVPVTYSHLIRAYNAVIRDRLNECLQTMASYMEYAGIDYQDSNNDQFHVVLVGGFGKFILVQNQVQEFFDSSSTGDKRFAFDLGENREFAVAMGAALLSERIITIKHTAPYAIGMISYTTDKKIVPNFAIRYREEISADRDFWICKGNRDKNPKCFINATGSVSDLLIGYDILGKQCNKLVIKSELSSKIKRAYDELCAEYAELFPDSSYLGLEHHIGFHMDDSEIVTLLIRAVKTGSLKRIELSSYQDMFELTEV